jgi:hypothetical protein
VFRNGVAIIAFLSALRRLNRDRLASHWSAAAEIRHSRNQAVRIAKWLGGWPGNVAVSVALTSARRTSMWPKVDAPGKVNTRSVLRLRLRSLGIAEVSDLPRRSSFSGNLTN